MEVDSKPMRRLREKTGVENLWLYVLAELAKGDCYPYALRRAVLEDFGVDAGKVVFYVVTGKLEAEGFIEGYYRDRRKYYRITERGRRLLKEGIAYLRTLADRLERVSEGGAARCEG
ncbi:PadR family transcriptional regulator [Thermofilum pendens]|uniref:Transcriptional regulator, PadR family n=1 Tax=Thermofilum pendens (strain DSM 2475 / Hrk 5) TaxID=368408 RepID=A1S081_THEPD|nr:helix-turn-helix transcriptional regulator [Thermofilum pendens]ABL78861.1 transcriptional regulator, PadR family [Thermofilum pendens Hrk 5]